MAVAMISRYHNVYENNAVCFWTSAIVERVPIFSSATAARAMIEILDECRGRCGVRLLAFVIMPDHIHLAVWSENADDVRRFLRQFLGISSARMVALADQAAAKGNLTAENWLSVFRAGSNKRQAVRVWKERGRAFPVSHPDALVQKLAYIHENPVRAGLVTRSDEWEYSSAAWYLCGTGPLSIDAIEW